MVIATEVGEGVCNSSHAPMLIPVDQLVDVPQLFLFQILFNGRPNGRFRMGDGFAVENSETDFAKDQDIYENENNHPCSSDSFFNKVDCVAIPITGGI